MNDSLEQTAENIVKIFTEKNLKLCAAESCTGGMVASSIVSVPKASAMFLGSAVCYCDEAKVSMLGVKRHTIEKYFAESAECASEMARGALNAFNADAAVATSGFLDGNVGEKPQSLAGTVFIACLLRGVENTISIEKIKLDVSKPRDYNRRRITLAALNLTIKNIKK